jgi:hypothetical protein
VLPLELADPPELEEPPELADPPELSETTLPPKLLPVLPEPQPPTTLGVKPPEPPAPDDEDVELSVPPTSPFSLPLFEPVEQRTSENAKEDVSKRSQRRVNARAWAS